MAKETDRNLENQMIYSVFVRNHSKEGSFAKLEKDLDRIRDLGTDIIWLMPVQPTGAEKRKGTDGSPYAIRDYRAIEPKMGTWEDLAHLQKEANKRGMKLMVDVVYNHTSPDSKLMEEHPEWFFRDENGHAASLVADWSDIVDLDYSNPELWDYQIETLKQFAKVTDGFRCDVASRLPVEFWKKARKEVAEVNPDQIWLAESCHLPFIKFIRDSGRIGESESALLEAFNMVYDYDAFPYAEEVMDGKKPISDWTDALIRQDAILPPDYIKIRYLENHDTDRMAEHLPEKHLQKNWTALLFLLRGAPMIYHGQEIGTSHRPDIFTQDPIAWKEDEERAEWIRSGAKIHKRIEPGTVILYEPDDENGILTIHRGKLTGIFELQQKPGTAAEVSVPNGTYVNLLNGKEFSIKDGTIAKEILPVIFEQEEAKVPALD